MATLNVEGVQVISFSLDTVVTAPDGNTYTAIANLRYGVPFGATALTVNLTDDVMCQTKTTPKFLSGFRAQVFAVDEVRTPA